MADLNKVMLIGRIGDPIDCTPLPSGISCFRACVSTRHCRKYDVQGVWVHVTHRHNIQAFGSLAEKCGEHLTPGQLVYVEGSLEPDGNGGTVIVAKDIHFLKSGGQQPAKEAPAG